MLLIDHPHSSDPVYELLCHLLRTQLVLVSRPAALQKLDYIAESVVELQQSSNGTCSQKKQLCETMSTSQLVVELPGDVLLSKAATVQMRQKCLVLISDMSVAVKAYHELDIWHVSIVLLQCSSLWAVPNKCQARVGRKAGHDGLQCFQILFCNQQWQI